LNLADDKKLYFLSDFHLGVPNRTESRLREQAIVRFLTKAEKDAAEIFLVGDLFDFWFEYRKVVPKGYVRLLGKLAELSDKGIRLHFFMGNHDMWVKNYFKEELNMQIYRGPERFTFNNRTFLVGHGDGLGPGDKGYKFLKKIFRNPLCQWLFGILPPAVGMGLAQYFSKKSRLADKSQEEKFLGEENEWLIIYAREMLQHTPTDYFVFGHRHLPIDFTLQPGSRYINLGEWLHHRSYACFDGNQLTLQFFKE